MLKFIVFQQQGTSASGLTKVWWVLNTGGNILGQVSWYAPWRSCWYTTSPNVGLDAACLREIADFCENETRAHKE